MSNRAMDIRPIRTEADYRAALKEAERLWDAEPGTLEGDQVEVLSTLIEALFIEIAAALATGEASDEQDHR